MMTDVEIIGVLKSYIRKCLEGVGALKGAPCEIQSITETSDGNIVMFKWEDEAGVSHTNTMEVKNGKDGKDGSIASVTPVLESGTKIAEMVIDGNTVSLYAPEGNAEPVYETLIDLDIMNDLTEYATADSVNVMSCGAIGDGTTDDSGAFTTALTQAASGNKHYILIPHGTYNLNDTEINVPMGITFVGENPNNCVLKNNHIVATQGFSAKGVGFDGGHDTTIQFAGGTTKTWNIIIYNTPTVDDVDVVLDGCIFKNSGIASFAQFTTNYDGVTSLKFGKVDVQNCVFKDLTIAGLWHQLYIDSGKYLCDTFENIGEEYNPFSVVTNPGTTNPKNRGWQEISPTTGWYMNTIDTSVVSGKTYYRHNFHNIVGIKAGDTSNETDNGIQECVIRNCRFDNFISNTYPAAEEHWDEANFVTVSGEGVVIVNNVFKDLKGYAHDREGVYTKARHCDIGFNYIANGGMGEGYICCKVMTTSDNTRHINIHDNILVGEYGNGIRLYGNGTIRGNSIMIFHASGAIIAGSVGSMRYISALPTPSASYANNQTTYVLTSDQSGYVKGHMYQCVADGNSYIWKEVGTKYSIGSCDIIDNNIEIAVDDFYIDGERVDNYHRTGVASVNDSVIRALGYLNINVSNNNVTFHDDFNNPESPFYWSTPHYVEVVPLGNENPTLWVWYEASGNSYVKTTDTTVVEGHTYYERCDYHWTGIYIQDFRNKLTVSKNRIVTNQIIVVNGAEEQTSCRGIRLVAKDEQLINGLVTEVDDNVIEVYFLPIDLSYNAEHLWSVPKKVYMRNNVCKNPDKITYSDDKGYLAFIRSKTTRADDVFVFETAQKGVTFKNDGNYVKVGFPIIETEDISMITYSNI